MKAAIWLVEIGFVIPNIKKVPPTIKTNKKVELKKKLKNMNTWIYSRNKQAREGSRKLPKSAVTDNDP